MSVFGRNRIKNFFFFLHSRHREGKFLISNNSSIVNAENFFIILRKMVSHMVHLFRQRGTKRKLKEIYKMRVVCTIVMRGTFFSVSFCR